MAEAVLNLVIANLVPWLVHEATLLRGIHGEISEVVDELQSIQSFIKDADEKAEKDEEEISHSAKTWVRKLREVTYQIEDVTDNYVLQMATEAAQREQCKPRLMGSFARLVCWIVSVKPRHVMAQEINQVKQTIHGIREKGQSYGFSSSSSSAMVRSTTNESKHDPRVSSLFIEEAEVVGIEGDRENLISWLVSGETKRAVVSVVGMGGLGKTTLARKVFDSQTVTNHFSNQAWITVSQSYKAEELLKKTLKEFYKARKESPPPKIDNMEETPLIFELREYLRQKKYMVVFDDVWSVEFWDFIRHALPNDNNNSQGSRVLITTRSDEVASSCNTSSRDHIYKLNRLPEDKALELFCKKVFHHSSDSSCNDVKQVPPELRELANNFVRRCEGLPLAIVTIGGLLSTKRKEVYQWQELEKNLGSELVTNRRLSNMTRILSLSYYELPYYLKLCLMYFGMLPEDYSIRHARLLRLWIAEGFVKGARGKSAEQAATECLVELVNRSLVQVSEVDVDGKIRKIRVHDLMREIILSKSKELRYGHVWADEEHSSSSFGDLARRLSIHGSCTDDDVLKICNGNGNGKYGTRSLLIFDVDNFPISVLHSFMNHFKLLKVLDLQDAPIDFLPEEVGDLFHLRYLSVRHTKTKRLPNSIGKLHNLQTLDLKCSYVHELPAETKNLQNLLYLIGYCYDYETDFSISAQRGLKLKQGFGRLQNLQKLYLVEANHGITLLNELKNLKQLRKLGITKLPTRNGKILCESIASITHLQCLEVCSEDEKETLDLQFMSSPPQYLQRLYLKGRLQKIPEWIPKLSNLVTLSLMWSGLTIDPLNILQHLPILSELVFQETFLGEQLIFQAAGFQKLKILKLYNMDTLMNLTIEKGALPLLELFKIGPIPRLNTVPTGIQYLTNLVALRFYDVSKEFALRLLPHQGQDFWVVQHVQTLLFHYQIKGERYKTYTHNDLGFLDD
ncbi:disease resistance protein RPM1-like [Beta vulgaris subsp. vulgaris]|uniref:disease resistance protein RPM1-like n=1 Tax=Beta vulgaris subsp. vulgaris TaxID=3555 RepID=UPI0020369F2A|nr:disease resistance protein RPM1-like [Beta vulgaris subsp. vulgaris]